MGSGGGGAGRGGGDGKRLSDLRSSYSAEYDRLKKMTNKGQRRNQIAFMGDIVGEMNKIKPGSASLPKLKP